MKKILSVLLLLFICGSIQLHTQDSKRRVIGLTANLQSIEYGINIPIWASQRFVIAPSIGLSHSEKLATDYSLGLKAQYYFSTEQFAPYAAIHAATLMNNPAGGAPGTSDYIFGLAGGAEYFFVPQFSLGVEAQANFTKSDAGSRRFGNPGGTTFNLGSAVNASIYFMR